nr:hypothetical protein [Tanacetum cinerariifolium]
MVQQALNQVVGTLLVFIDEQLVLDMIINESLVLDEQLVLDMIADELVLHMVVVVEEMCRIVVVEELLKIVDCTEVDCTEVEDYCIMKKLCDGSQECKHLVVIPEERLMCEMIL